VPVIIDVEPDGLRLTSNGREIGEWPAGEFSIDHHGGSQYTITAENETIRFVPARPELFAAGVGVGRDELSVTETAADTEAQVEEPPIQEPPADTVPPPKPLTRALFYTLAGTTAALGLWALSRLIF
jgi:hypothetical protein